MNEWPDEIRKTYRNYMAEELKRPEVAQAQKKLASHFGSPMIPMFEPVSALAAFALVGLFCFFVQIQPPARKVVLPETQPVMLALSPKPVIDAVNPMVPRVMVKKISSRTGTPMIYQENQRDIPITVIWIFPGGQPK